MGSDARRAKKKKNGSQATRKKEKSFCKGLMNVGHTCYINCILQYIVNSPIAAFFLSGPMPGCPENLDPDAPLDKSALQRQQVVKELDTLIHAMHREERPVAPTNLAAAIWKAADLAHFTMEDAHVCWLAFANCLDCVLLDPSCRSKCRFECPSTSARAAAASSPPASDPASDSASDPSSSTSAVTLSRYFFGCTVWSTVVCSRCGYSSRTSEACFDLQVALPEDANDVSPSTTGGPPAAKVLKHLGSESNVLDLASPAGEASSSKSPPLCDVDSACLTGDSACGTQVEGDPDSAAPSCCDGPSNTASEGPEVSGSDHLGRAPPRGPDRHKSPLSQLHQPLGCLSSCISNTEVFRAFGGEEGGATLPDALQQVYSAEPIEGFRCASCNHETTAFRRLSIRKLPSQLMLHIKRFQMDTKLRGHMHCPLELDMLAYTSAAQEAARSGRGAEELRKMHADGAFRYRLKAVVEHAGSRLHGGHFVTYVRVADVWHFCDDHRISTVDPDAVLRAEAYIVCYEHDPAGV